ncbi:MAG: DUF2769 domain-containing protein [Candidatus Odinarchaeia archaeon]
MDKFEETMSKMATMTPEQAKLAMQENMKLCTCPQCPSYNNCAKDNNELLYCATGKSPTCITDEAGCICPSCPVTPKMGLKNLYYCTRGSEKEIRGM